MAQNPGCNWYSHKLAHQGPRYEAFSKRQTSLLSGTHPACSDDLNNNIGQGRQAGQCDSRDGIGWEDDTSTNGHTGSEHCM